MDDSVSVFLVGASVEDDRPAIAFDAPANQGIDWQRLDEVLRGLRSLDEYQEPSIRVDRSDATEWHYYLVPGTLGLISNRAVERIGRPAFRHYHLLRAWLNGEDYRFLQCKEVLPCLDLEKSVVVPFRSNPNRIKEVKAYGFKKRMLDDPLCFSITEVPGLFATQSVQQVVERERLQGFHFTPVD